MNPLQARPQVPTALALMVLAVLAGTTSTAQAQSWPSRPVRMVIPWPTGGSNDIIGRAVAERLAEALRQPVVVENRGGSNGVIGTEAVVRAAPDGYTLLFHNVNAHVINPAIYGKLPYDSERDLAPVALVAPVAHVVVVHPAVPVQSIAQLVAMAKATPGKLSYASFGNGSSSHLSGELFRAMAGVDMGHVPYKGGGPALTDTLAGHVPVYFASVTTALASIRAGKLRALAVTGPKRSRLMPDVPTLDETPGFRGYETLAMLGTWFPASTPRELVARLNGEVVRAIGTPEFRAKLDAQGFDDPVGGSPEDMAAYIRRELPKWAKLVRDSGAKLD
jgi:tripartite-type tricarboxylate transporter receptor subunit TctC